MKVSTIKSNWLAKGGFRLDCSPYLGGAIETEILLDELPVRKDTLGSVTSAIFNGPQFVRNYVDDPEFGVPFLTGGSMLLADLSDLPFLSRHDALSSKLRNLQIKHGMTLISCSGTIGKMTYARPDMEGILGSQDILKVVPNKDLIPPGYLYAFLSSKFGVPLVTSGTYGAVIQHLEPDHITGLSVPRFGEALEENVHSLVEESSKHLDKYGSLLRDATAETLSLSGIQDIPRHLWNTDNRRFGWAQQNIRSDTLRALNYDPRIAHHFDSIRRGAFSQLGDLCDPRFFVATIVFSRIDSDLEHGVKLVGQREAFRIWPEGRIIARSSIEKLGLLVEPGATLIPSHGTFGEFELFCRAVYATKRTSAYAFGGDFFRCVPMPGSIPPGYLFSFMRSDVAFRMLRSISAGSKQQYQHRSLMYEFPIPRLDSKSEERISAVVDEAADCFDRALDCEEAARGIVENAILNT